MQTVASVIGYLDQFAPRSIAEDWDNVGLLLGDRKGKAERALTCLTITPDVVQEAVDNKVDLIVTHHPILFRGAKRLTSDTTEGRMLLSLIQANIAVYSPHTAFDNTRGGINEMLAQRLGLTDVSPMRPGNESASCKIVVFVPEGDLDPVSQAMFRAGAGRIGEYSQCSFRVSGVGTFQGSEHSNPTIGKPGRREEVDEMRLEVVCPQRRIDAVVKAMREAHSYEEPAFDVYLLRQETSETNGSGRIGKFSKAITLQNAAELTRKELNSGPVQVVGKMTKKVQSVAICCGAGGEMLSDAIRARVDVFLTGEMRFHDYLRAEAEEIGLILPGHYATERFAVVELVSRLKEQFPEVEVSASEQDLDPVKWV